MGCLPKVEDISEINHMASCDFRAILHLINLVPHRHMDPGWLVLSLKARSQLASPIFRGMPNPARAAARAEEWNSWVRAFAHRATHVSVLCLPPMGRYVHYLDGSPNGREHGT
jgi:hypothetical protein